MHQYISAMYKISQIVTSEPHKVNLYNCQTKKIEFSTLPFYIFRNMTWSKDIIMPPSGNLSHIQSKSTNACQ